MYFASKKVCSAAPTPLARPSPSLPSVPLGGRVPLNVPSPSPSVIPNTNILSIDLGELTKEVKLFTGDPVVCNNCEAIFNSSSTLSKSETADSIWICEFCQSVNKVDLEEEEIPRNEEQFDYLLSPALTSGPPGFSKEKLVIFCIDISGSMCVSTQIKGSLKLRGDSSKNNVNMIPNDNPNQWLPNESRGMTYVSRLQCVQAAISSQLENFVSNSPDTRVGLVVFSNDVTVLGDGTQTPTVVTGDRLYNWDALLEIGFECGKTSIGPIKTSKATLEKKVYELSEGGSTALGPAVLVAVGMAQNAPGSTIVIATDGLANTGIGAMDNPDAQTLATTYYTKLSDYAKEKNITVNIIGIKGGDELNLGVIGKLAQDTMGEVDIVNPEKIIENFGNILQAKLVATDVTMKLFLHKGFVPPQNEEWKKPSEDKLYAVRKIGTAYDDTEVTAEFNPRPVEELVKLARSYSELTKKAELPFQVQIEYTAPNGMKCIRVITRTKEITDNLEEVIKDVDIGVLGMHATAKRSKLAQQGDVIAAINETTSYAALMQNAATTSQEKANLTNWNNANSNLFRSPQVQQQMAMQTSPFPPQPAYGQMLMPPMQQQQQQQQQQQMAMPTSFAFSSFVPPPSTNFSGMQPQMQQQQQYQQQQQQQQLLSPSPVYGDSVNNMLFQDQNQRVQKRNWKNPRKY